MFSIYIYLTLFGIKRYDFNSRTSNTTTYQLCYLQSFFFTLPINKPVIFFFFFEYAMEAIGHAGTCLGMLADDGILLAAERRNTNKLLDEAFHSEKIYHLNENMACSVAGITSDANVLVNLDHFNH
jgi:hypothetical protein